MHPVLFHLGAVVIPSYGAFAALGLLLALGLALHTARMTGVHPGHLWNLCVVSLFAALIGSRLLLVAANWTDLRRHPLWVLGLATIHHPLVAAVGALTGLIAALLCAFWQHLPLWSTADALAAPLALGLSFEQLGELLAGSSFGTETSARWAITYTDPLAELWSGTPIGIPVHPVQAYAGIAFLLLALALVVCLPRRRQSGDIAGAWLMGTGVAVFATEFWRDREGRGSLLGGTLDGPQVAAIVLVLAGALALLERKRTRPAISTGNQETHA